MELRMVAFDDPDAVKLIAGIQQEYVERRLVGLRPTPRLGATPRPPHGGPDTTPVDPAEFAPPQGIFVVGYLDGTPVACGGWRAHGSEAEIKRMYVAASARGNGFARAVLAELERTAAEAGFDGIRLETGKKQPEAIALYKSSGYHRIPNYGIYRYERDCVCFAKRLG